MALKLATGVQHRFVLGFDGNEMLALVFIKMRCALNGQVVGFGGARGPHNLAGVCAHQVRHLSAGFFNGSFGFPAPRVAAGCGVTKMAAQPRHHGIHHPLVTRVGGAVIQINGEVRCGVHIDIYDLFKEAPKANTELGALTFIGLGRGTAVMERLPAGLSLIETPLEI